jgi:hypothetical protein
VAGTVHVRSPTSLAQQLVEVIGVTDFVELGS